MPSVAGWLAQSEVLVDVDRLRPARSLGNVERDPGRSPGCGLPVDWEGGLMDEDLAGPPSSGVMKTEALGGAEPIYDA